MQRSNRLQSVCASLAAAAALVTGCGLSTDVPADGSVVIACDDSANCPTGWLCVEQRCVPESRDDFEAPSLVGESTVPSPLGIGEFSVSFQVSESLAVDPTVTLSLSGTTRELALQSADGLSFNYALTVDSSTPEGSGTLFVDLVDEVGNAARGVSLGRFTVDRTAPELVFVSATPAVARLGTTIIYAITANEDLIAPPTLVVRDGSGAEIEDFFSLIDGTFYRFQHTVSGSDADGVYAVSVRMQDLAGNESKTLTFDDVPKLPEAQIVDIAIDASAPVLENLQIARASSPASPIARINQSGELLVALDAYDGSSPASLNVVVGAYGMDCDLQTFPRYHCTLDMNTVAASDGADMPQSVIIEAFDSAGNASFLASSVVFDFLPPVPVTATLGYEPGPQNPLNRVTALTNGSRLVVTTTLNEPIESASAMTLDALG